VLPAAYSASGSHQARYFGLRDYLKKSNSASASHQSRYFGLRDYLGKRKFNSNSRYFGLRDYLGKRKFDFALFWFDGLPWKTEI
jgi:hypothetical protein